MKQSSSGSREPLAERADADAAHCPALTAVIHHHQRAEMELEDKNAAEELITGTHQCPRAVVYKQDMLLMQDKWHVVFPLFFFFHRSIFLREIHDKSSCKFRIHIDEYIKIAPSITPRGQTITGEGNSACDHLIEYQMKFSFMVDKRASLLLLDGSSIHLLPLALRRRHLIRARARDLGFAAEH